MASTSEQRHRHVTETETRLVLIGRTGEGKSATGNSIVGRNTFDAKITAGSDTKKCNMVKDVIQGKSVLVIDTPWLFDTRDGATNETTLLEIIKCLTLSAPGPHAFILTMSASRFTQELIDTIERLRETFSEDVLKHTIVVITRKDQLEDEETTVEEFLESAPAYIKDILKACDNRYIAFNNKLIKKKNVDENNAQVAALLQMVDILVKTSGVFSSAKYEEIEQNLLQEEAERNKKIDKEYRPKIDECDYQIQVYDKRLNELREWLISMMSGEAILHHGESSVSFDTGQMSVIIPACTSKSGRKLSEKAQAHAQAQAMKPLQLAVCSDKEYAEAGEREEEYEKARQERQREQRQMEELKKKAEEKKAKLEKELTDKKQKVRDDIRDEVLNLKPAVGVLGGAAAGGAAGAAVGSLVPVVGTVLGGSVGAIVGAIAGLFVSKKKN